MNFSKPEKVLQTIRAGDTSEWTRGQNRTKITKSANGAPPLDDEQAKKLGITINVNWLELALLLSHARRQYYNSFLRGTRFFKVSLPLAPEEKSAEWGRFITDRINRPLMANDEFGFLHEYRWTDVVVHGVASVLWDDEDDWCPRFMAREDFRVATDTECSFRNLEWFAHRCIYTPGELVAKVWGENADPHWDKKGMAKIMNRYKEANYDSAMNAYDWNTHAEKLNELMKQNMGFYSSDAVPGIPIWSFYFKDTDRKWYLVALADSQARGAENEPDKFLYQRDTPIATDLRRLVHCQYGDLNFKTPFMFHSVRSLGFMLLEPTFYSNLTNNRLLQHVHQNFNPWLQIGDPGDKARTQAIEFNGPVTRIPQGVHILTGAERHQIDAPLVEMALAQLKQRMQEASASYTQDVDTGTNREQTAFETGVKVQQVNAMLSGLMLKAFRLERSFDREICRRFCRSESANEDVKEFLEDCQKAGIPSQWIDVNLWDVETEQPLGAGNPTMEMVQANQLMGLRGQLNPTAQQEVLHDALTVFADSKRAARWAPIGKAQPTTSAQLQAQADFGSLMWGSPVPIRDELNPIEQIETLIGKMAGVIQQIQQSGGMADQQQIVGLSAVAQHIGLLIERLAQNPAEKQRVAKSQQDLGRITNEVKAFAQRLQQAKQAQAKEAQKNNGADGAAKAQATVAQARLDMQLEQLNAGSKNRREDIKLMADERRKNAKFSAEQRRANIGMAADLSRTREQSKANNKLASESE